MASRHFSSVPRDLIVVFYEEPTLRRTFGSEYHAYCNRIRRWWPSLHPAA